jgi:hypothetical protein
VLPHGLAEKVAECTVGMLDMDMTACELHHGHVYAFAKGHTEVSYALAVKVTRYRHGEHDGFCMSSTRCPQDCTWRDEECLPRVLGTQHIEPLPEYLNSSHVTR